jgi:ABC-type Fe3+/spermidine/putrescine transport system ATPase subunit/ABC-type sulfate transport system permease component
VGLRAAPRGPSVTTNQQRLAERAGRLLQPATTRASQARPALWRTPLPWLAAVLALYLTAPVLVFLARSAGNPRAGFGVPGLFSALATSAETATISALLVGLAGIPLAYLLARRSGLLASAAGLAVQLPLALPPLVSGVVLLYVFGPYTVLGRLSGGRFTESLAGIVLAQSFVASPYLVVAARSAFRSVEPHLEDVAATAGLRPLARFARVALPLAGPGIRAGLVLTWLRAFGEYGATVMLSYHPYSLPVFTYVQFSAIGLPATQAPVLLALAAAAGVLGLARLPLPWNGRRRKLKGGYRASAGAPGTAGSGDLASKATAPWSSKTATGGKQKAGDEPALQVTERPRQPVPVAFEISVRRGSFLLQARHSATSHRLAIVGPSGAGKSLTLRSLAGLEHARVSFAGRPVGHLPPERRRVGYLPQGESLMPHMTAWANVTLGPNANPAAAQRWMAALGMSGLAGRLPAEMSGGQRRRVGLARALSCRAHVVLLDEPFGGLDAPQRTELLHRLRRLQLEAGLSSVLVTHDFTEAALLADELVVICEGRVVQAGRLDAVFEKPAGPNVARVLGFANLLPGVATGPTCLASGGLVVTTARHEAAAGEPVTWCVRPEHLSLTPAANESLTRAAERAGGGAHLALVADVAELPGRALVTVTVAGGTELQVEMTKPPFPRPGSPCWLAIPPEAVLVWPAEE